jgi:hypothetical protein
MSPVLGTWPKTKKSEHAETKFVVGLPLSKGEFPGVDNLRTKLQFQGMAFGRERIKEAAVLAAKGVYAGASLRFAFWCDDFACPIRLAWHVA